MITSKCRSKNPSACPYHGKGQSLSTMEKEAAKQAGLGNFEKYTFIRNAMDEIIKDTTFSTDVQTGDKLFEAIKLTIPEVSSDSSPVEAYDAQLKEEQVNKKIAVLEKAKHNQLFVAEVAAYDRKFAQYDKDAAKALGLKVAKRGGVGFKFYDTVSPASRNPDNYVQITESVRNLRHGDIISTGTIHSVVRGLRTPAGKSEVIVKNFDGNYTTAVWSSSTQIAASREKVSESV